MSLGEEVKLADVAEFVRGITFKPDDVVPLGTDASFACMRTKNVQGVLDCSDVWAVPSELVRRKDQMLSEGDILVSSANSWNLVGKCSWIPKLDWPASFGGFVSVLRANSQKIEPRFLYRWFSWDKTQAILRSYGQQTTNISNLNIERCLSMRLRLPPLSEQRRIAAILDQADALRAKRREALALLDDLQRGIFIEMFGDPVKNPMGWPLVPFDTACPTRLGKMLDKKQQTGKNPRRYLRNANVQWFRFDLTDVFEMDFDGSAREMFRLRSGDLLICEGGEPGRAAIWRNELEECYYQKALHRGRSNPDLAVPEYLAWLLWFFAKKGGLFDHITSATIAHLTGEKLKAMQIPLPPLERQLEFVRRIEGASNVMSSMDASRAAMDNFFSSLQHRAFRGEL